MTNFLLSIFLLLSTSVAFAAKDKTTYSVSTDASNVQWVGTKVTGKHDGSIKVTSGSMVFAGDKWVSGEFVVNMDSITVKDIENPEYNKKLVNHLRSDDFFSVDKHKTSTLKVKTVTPEKNGKVKVVGDLTIKGITKPIIFTADLDKKDAKVSLKGSITVDRTLYDVKYGSGKFFESLGDKMIHDNFTLNVDVMAKK